MTKHNDPLYDGLATIGNMFFDSLVQSVGEALDHGDVPAARAVLDRAWLLASDSPSRRDTCHTLGNTIQAAIFEQYMSIDV